MSDPNEKKDEEKKDPVDEDGLIKEKMKKTGYSAIIRIIVTGENELFVDSQIENIISAFSQFTAPGYNRLAKVATRSPDLLIKQYIFRQFPLGWKKEIWNTEEIASVYHFPINKYNKQPEIKCQ